MASGARGGFRVDHDVATGAAADARNVSLVDHQLAVAHQGVAVLTREHFGGDRRVAQVHVEVRQVDAASRGGFVVVERRATDLDERVGGRQRIQRGAGDACVVERQADVAGGLGVHGRVGGAAVRQASDGGDRASGDHARARSAQGGQSVSRERQAARTRNHGPGVVSSSSSAGSTDSHECGRSHQAFHCKFHLISPL